MDWFKRYGIPGAYFLALMAGWMYALYQCWPFNLGLDNLAKLVVFLFLPVGYILSILGQLCYLGSKVNCLNFKAKVGGLHCKAYELVKEIPFKKDKIMYESDMEALSCLNAAISDLDTATGKKSGNLEAHKFIQEWIRKRMDVVVINKTIKFATFSAIIGALIAFIIDTLFNGFRLEPEKNLIILLGLITIVVPTIMCKSLKKLERQITIVIAGSWSAIPPGNVITKILENKEFFRGKDLKE